MSNVANLALRSFVNIFSFRAIFPRPVLASGQLVAMSAPSNRIVELNVGGQVFCTTLKTITAKHPKSKLAVAVQSYCCGNQAQDGKDDAIPYLYDTNQRMFIDRDGDSFRFVLNYLRRAESGGNDSMGCEIPNASDRCRVQQEATYFGLNELASHLEKLSVKTSVPGGQKQQIYNPNITYEDALQNIKNTKRNHLYENPEYANVFGVLRVVTKSATKPPRTSEHQSKPFSSVYAGPLPITTSESQPRSLDSRSNGSALSQNRPFFMTIGYRGTGSATRDSISLEKFRRITRITISGRADVAKEIFRDDLNDSRDPDRYPFDGYTSRYYLKHNYLEHALETMASHGFVLVTSCSSGSKTLPAQAKEFKQWTSYAEYVFYRPALNE